MRHKVLAIGLIAALAAVVLAGCSADKDGAESIAAALQQTAENVLQENEKAAAENAEAESLKGTELTESEEPAVDYTQIYGEVLDSFYDFIANGADADTDDEGRTGVMEAVMAGDGAEGLNSIGYAIEDISGDGVPELLVGAISENDGSVYRGSEIYTVYTCVDGVPHYSFEGWSRNGCYVMDKGEFFRIGSNGAMYTIFGTYTISPDGTELQAKEYYFSFEKDESFEQMGFYYNTTGEWDKAVSEELDISDDEFWQIDTELEAQIQTIELIPFSQYR